MSRTGASSSRRSFRTVATAIRAAAKVEAIRSARPRRPLAQLREEIHAEVCREGYDAERKTFTQSTARASSTRAS